MKIKPEKLLYWNKRKHLNDDAYGQYVFNYAEEWANMMENDIIFLNSNDIVDYLKESAEKISFETEHCKGGLTGFQHDCAVDLLINCWKYGVHLYLGLILERVENMYCLSKKQEEYYNKYVNKDKKLMEMLEVST